MVAVNARVIYDGKKATVIQVWRKTVRILTAGMEKMNVPIADLILADGQLELIDTARYEKPRAGFTDWEMENGDIDERENAIALTKESELQETDPDETEGDRSLEEKWIGARVRFRGGYSDWWYEGIVTRLWLQSQVEVECSDDIVGYPERSRCEIISHPESSITPPVIELDGDLEEIRVAARSPESSITPPVIEPVVD
jgi:hypothetical protein